MEIHQLRTFVTVAREGKLTCASALLFVSQPAVSAHIKAPEDDLGVALFERTSKGMKLTPGGEALLRQAEAVLAALVPNNVYSRRMLRMLPTRREAGSLEAAIQPGE